MLKCKELEKSGYYAVVESYGIYGIYCDAKKQTFCLVIGNRCGEADAVPIPISKEQAQAIELYVRRKRGE